MSDCIFCKIVAGRDPGGDRRTRASTCIAFRDINPQAPTHVQIIPRKHVAHIADFDAGAGHGVARGLFDARERRSRRDEGLDKGFRLVINNGPLSGQSVFHVHLHILGGRQLGWPPG